MLSIHLEKVTQLLDQPIYVFRQVKHNVHCEKLTYEKGPYDEEGVWKSARYIIGGNQCSCIGFAHRQTCKHMQMLKEEYVTEHPAKVSEVTPLLERIIAACRKALPESVPEWSEFAEHLDDRDVVSTIVLGIKDSELKNVLKVCAMKKFVAKRQVLFVFKWVGTNS